MSRLHDPDRELIEDAIERVAREVMPLYDLWETVEGRNLTRRWANEEWGVNMEEEE